MSVDSLNHYTIRPTDLEATRNFYVDVLGLEVGARPPFPFPGYWLYCGGIPTVHLIGTMPEGQKAVREYLGDRNAGKDKGTGNLDHIAFIASKLPDMKQRLAKQKIAYEERVVPMLGQIQLFLEDPNGIMVELNFPASESASAA
jgi:catechol 2,3-dioxygenase-like lactoylglutathione lyase family enzyme